MLNLSSVTRWAILSFQYLAIQNNENLPKSMTILPNTKNTVTQEKAKKFKKVLGNLLSNYLVLA